MKTARLTLLLDPAEKAAIEARAAALGCSAGAFLRRAAEAYDPESETEDLRELAGDLAETVARIDAKLARMSDVLDRADRLAERRETMRREARETLGADPRAWPFPAPAPASA